MVSPDGDGQIVQRKRLMRKIELKRIAGATFLVGMIVLIISVVMPAVGWKVACVDGQSMEPALYSGDLVVTRPACDVDEGDICIYKAGDGKTIIHRVAIIAGDVYVFQGDHNSSVDIQMVTRDQITGVVIFHVRTYGVPTGAVLVLCMVGLFCLLYLIAAGLWAAVVHERGTR